MSSRTERRKNYFIKKRFQANFFVRFALLLLLEAALIAGLFMFISRGTLTTAYYGTELRLQKTGTFFFVSFLLISLIVGIAVGIAGIFIFMYLSHRIAGPLYKFEKVIEEAKLGNLTQRPSLRSTDEVHELMRRMNACLEEMDTRISDIKGGVNDGLEAISNTGAEGGLAKAERILEKLKASLMYFKTSR